MNRVAVIRKYNSTIDYPTGVPLNHPTNYDGGVKNGMALDNNFVHQRKLHSSIFIFVHIFTIVKNSKGAMKSIQIKNVHKNKHNNNDNEDDYKNIGGN